MSAACASVPMSVVAGKLKQPGPSSRPRASARSEYVHIPCAVFVIAGYYAFLFTQDGKRQVPTLFLTGLNESPYFTDVDLDSTKLGTAKDGGLKLVSFVIRAVVVNSPPEAKS